MSGHIFFSALPLHFPEDQVPLLAIPEKKERISSPYFSRNVVESGKNGVAASFISFS